MESMGNRETQVGVRMRQVDRLLLTRIADTDQVSISATVRRLIYQESLRRGYVTPEPAISIAELPKPEGDCGGVLRRGDGDAVEPVESRRREVVAR